MPRLIQDVLRPLVEYRKFKGIDNLATDNMRVPKDFVRAASNVDIDSEDMPHLRKGTLQQVLSGNCHSLWSDEGSLCFFVKDGTIIQVNQIYRSGGVWMINYTEVLSGLGDTKMTFMNPPGYRTYFSNLLKIGYVEYGVAYSFPSVPVYDSTKPSTLRYQFKKTMVNGTLIEYFNSRLYAVQDEFVFFSDAANPMVMDVRKNFLTFGGPISMFLAVKDGIYISHGNKVAWLRYMGEAEFPIDGGKLGIPDFDYKLLLDVPTIPGSALPIERLDLGKAAPPGYKGVIGRLILFSTSIGIFMGLPGGHIHDCTSDHYAVYDAEEGSAIMQWYNGYRQYVFIGQTPVALGLNSFKTIDPPDTASIISS